MAYAVAAPRQNSKSDAASNTTQGHGKLPATGAANGCSNASTTALTVAVQTAGHQGCTWFPALLLAGQAYAALGDPAQAVVHLGQVGVKQPQQLRLPAFGNHCPYDMDLNSTLPIHLLRILPQHRFVLFLAVTVAQTYHMFHFGRRQEGAFPMASQIDARTPCLTYSVQ